MTWQYEKDEKYLIYRILGDDGVVICECWKEEVAKIVCDAHNASKQTPTAYMSGWVCPICGRGNAPFTSTCSCIPLPAPIVTCQK